MTWWREVRSWAEAWAESVRGRVGRNGGDGVGCGEVCLGKLDLGIELRFWRLFCCCDCGELEDLAALDRPLWCSGARCCVGLVSLLWSVACPTGLASGSSSSFSSSVSTISLPNVSPLESFLCVSSHCQSSEMTVLCVGNCENFPPSPDAFPAPEAAMDVLARMRTGLSSSRLSRLSAISIFLPHRAPSLREAVAVAIFVDLSFSGDRE